MCSRLQDLTPWERARQYCTAATSNVPAASEDVGFQLFIRDMQGDPRRDLEGYTFTVETDSDGSTLFRSTKKRHGETWWFYIDDGNR